MRCLFWLAACLCAVSMAQEKRAMTFEDMFTMKRVSNLSVSPDGRHVLFRVQQADIEANKLNGHIAMLNMADGSVKTVAPAGSGSPSWRPDGQAFAYAQGGQIYIKSLDGAEPRQATDIKSGASGPRFSRDGKWLLFTSSVAVGQEKDHSGKLIEGLLFRQWNEWVDDKRNHVFIVSADAEKDPGRDLTPGLHDSPPLDLGSSHDYTFSPDGKEVAIVKNTDEVVATSTNNDIFTIDLATGKETRITTNRGGDAEPHYSPDGRYIAYVSMAREGFEADQHVIKLYDRREKKHIPLSHETNHSADHLIWTPDSKSIYYQARVAGARSIFKIDLNGAVHRLTEQYLDGNTCLADGKLVFTRESTTMPAEIFTLDLASKAVRQMTFLNKPVLDQLEMNPWEPFWFKSPNGADVQGFVIKPPFFEEGKKYPMIYLIHGGPQGMWSNQFHYRWNAQMFAAPGYVVVQVNPHGSKGYGQKFCDAVTRDWGGLPYQDLMKGVDVALERFPYIDPERIGAAGASYGGYMVNWIATHDHPFQALVSHNGVFNLPSMAGSTEELWFTEWEFGGTYYEHPELYEKWSPHRRAGNMKTPMLVIHSENDFRVPLNQGMELFSALQRLGVASQWLYFPDEDHFVSKPHNARMWWRTVHGWVDRYVKPAQKPAG